MFAPDEWWPGPRAARSKLIRSRFGQERSSLRRKFRACRSRKRHRRHQTTDYRHRGGVSDVLDLMPDVYFVFSARIVSSTVSPTICRLWGLILSMVSSVVWWKMLWKP